MGLIYGYSGCGKTHALSTLPHDKTLIINSDKGHRTLNNLCPEMSITNLSTVEDSREMLELISKYRYIAFDSLTAFGELLLIEFKGMKTGNGNPMHGQKAYGMMGDVITKMLYHFATLPHVFIITAQDQRANHEDNGVFDYCYCPEIPGKSYSRALPFRFDFVWPIRVHLTEDENGNQIQERRFQTNMTGDGQYMAKTRGNELDLFEDVDFQKIFKKMGIQ